VGQNNGWRFTGSIKLELSLEQFDRLSQRVDRLLARAKPSQAGFCSDFTERWMRGTSVQLNGDCAHHPDNEIARLMLAVVWGEACGIGPATQPACADLADLTPDQRRTARCMLTVLSKVRGVTEPILRIATIPDLVVPHTMSTYLFLDYTYHHLYGANPNPSISEIEITRLVATKKGGFVLGGLASYRDGRDLNDNDDGMLRVTEGWEKGCGLDLFVMTV
jgi:hypothetical protein